MYARVLGEFRVKGRSKDMAVLHENGLPFMPGENRDSRANFFDDRRANENHLERLFLERARLAENVAGELTAVAVSEDGHAQELQRILRRILNLIRQENGAGTGAEDRASRIGEFADGIVEALLLQELELRGAFAAGEDKSVATLQIGDRADFDGFSTELPQHGGVCFEVALNGEDANFHLIALCAVAYRWPTHQIGQLLQ